MNFAMVSSSRVPVRSSPAICYSIFREASQHLIAYFWPVALSRAVAIVGLRHLPAVAAASRWPAWKIAGMEPIVGATAASYS